MASSVIELLRKNHVKINFLFFNFFMLDREKDNFSQDFCDLLGELFHIKNFQNN